MQILAPHEETSVLTQLGDLPEDSEIEAAVGRAHCRYPVLGTHSIHNAYMYHASMCDATFM